jgi:hypothetical protein
MEFVDITAGRIVERINGMALFNVCGLCLGRYKKADTGRSGKN